MAWTPTKRMIRSMLQNGLGNGTFRKFFIGDPMALPSSYLPCIIVTKLKTKYHDGATSTQKVEEHITIKVVFNKMTDIGAPDDSVDLVEDKLEAIVEGCDPVTGMLLPGTIMSILLSNQFYGDDGTNNWILGAEFEDDYYIDDRGLKDQMITQEAHINVIVTSDKVVTRA